MTDAYRAFRQLERFLDSRVKAGVYSDITRDAELIATVVYCSDGRIRIERPDADKKE